MLWLRLAAGLALLAAGLAAATGAGRPRGSTRAVGAWMARAARHPLGGTAAGIGATLVLQSSSLATIAVVGMVNAGVVDLDGAAALIVGANVGATFGTHLLAWRASAVIWQGLAIAGALAWAVRRTRGAGRCLLGVAAVLAGLGLVEAAASGLGQQPWFAEALFDLSGRPWLGLGAGAVLTAIVLSSHLTIGVLGRLAGAGLVGVPAALPVVFGANVGTTADTLLSSLAGGRAARRAALFHLLFNLAGSLLFMPLLPVASGLLRASGAEPARQVALAHTMFNVGAAAVVLPARRALMAVTGWAVREPGGRLTPL